MDQATKTMIANMPEKTGKSLAEWKALLKEHNFSKHSEAMKFLKGTHGVTHGYANSIILLSKDDKPTDDDLVTNQYKGKEALTPIYEALLARIEPFGDDVQIVPKKTSVSCVRKKQFALIKPATKTRIDLGLKLKDVPTTDRLEDSGPFGTMCTHRVRLTAADQVDEQLVEWLKVAYERAD